MEGRVRLVPPALNRAEGTMRSVDPAAAELERSSERWLAWLGEELARRQPRSAVLALWDVLEEWFASDDFAGSAVAAAVVAPPDGRGPAAQAARRLLEDLARSAGARDPAALAAQLLTLVEGAMAGALIDHHPGAARHARELTQIALEA